MFIFGQNYDIIVNTDNISGLHIEQGILGYQIKVNDDDSCLAVYKTKEVAEVIFKGLFALFEDKENLLTILPTDDEAIEIFEELKKRLNK